MNTLLTKQNAEYAARVLKFATLEQIYNTPLTGEEEKDMAIADAVFEFIEAETTNMTDKIAAAKYLAPVFGEDAETINEEFVKELLSETASASTLFPNSRPIKSKERAASIKWFGARELKDHQVVNKEALDQIMIKANNKAKDYAAKFYENNEKIANDILKRIGKMIKSKVRVVSKTRKAGFLFVVFSVDAILNFPEIKQRNGVRITKHGSKEYHLFVGDLHTKG